MYWKAEKDSVESFQYGEFSLGCGETLKLILLRPGKDYGSSFNVRAGVYTGGSLRHGHTLKIVQLCDGHVHCRLNRCPALVGAPR